MSHTPNHHDLSTIDYGMQPHPGPVAWSDAAKREIETIEAGRKELAPLLDQRLAVALHRFAATSFLLAVLNGCFRPKAEVHD